MLRLTEDTGRLTVYNGIEEQGQYKSLDGSRSIPDMCCKKGDDTDDKIDKCWFKENCTTDMKLLHRKLILGEPLKISSTDDKPHPMGDLFNSWDLKGLEHVIHVATQALEKIKGREHFEVVKTEKDENDFYVAVALIKIFIQLNYTGPSIPSADLKEKLQLFDSENNEVLRKYLELDGSELDGTVKSPVLLLIAKYFLSSMENDKTSWPFHLIWRFRIDFLHQRMLSRRTWSLSRNLKYYADKFIQWFESPHTLDGVLEDVHATIMCEISQMLIYYYDGILSERFLMQAKKLLNVTVNFTGKLGFRTKYQQTPAPQTIADVSFVESSDHCDNTGPAFPALTGVVPQSEDLNDDTRLEKIRLVDEEQVQPHREMHQLILMGMMFFTRGVDGTELDRQEVEALIRVVIENPLTWSCRLSAIMDRCRLEKSDMRAIDRSLRQLQALWKTVSKHDETAHSIYRQYLFFGSGHPTKSEIKGMLGEILLSMEHWKEALTIYTELGSFEKIVRCYEMMNLRHKAEDLIRSKMKDMGETPKLLVLLGDVTSDKSFYEKAWEMSSQKSVDSQIKLGNYHFKRQEFAESVAYFKRVVELAPLEYPCWLRLAWASYQTEDYETAYQAYLHAANMEYDNFQVWNNLANCALKLGRKEYALRGYKEAVKCSYDEWKVWNNILTVATELKVLSDAVMAYHRILDLNKSFSDEMVLDELTNFVIAESKPKAAKLGNLAKLFGRVTSMGVRNFHVWLLYGRLLVAYIDCDNEDCKEETKCSNYERGLHNYDKALTLARQNPLWKSDMSLLRNIVNCIAEFRTQRQRGEIVLGKDFSANLRGMDTVLRNTATSVYREMLKLKENLPANEKFQELFNDMQDEVTFPFYTAP